MYITPPASHHTGLMNIQEWLLMTVVCLACRFYEGLAQRGEKEQQVIELFSTSHFLQDQPIPEQVTLILHMTAYDIEKMQLLKSRMQRAKELITRYSKLTTDRAACVQSSLPSAPYTISVTCTLNTKKNIREVERKQRISPLEEMYIRRYQVFCVLFTWWDTTMSTSLFGTWIQLTVDQKTKMYIEKVTKEKALGMKKI